MLKRRGDACKLSISCLISRKELPDVRLGSCSLKAEAESGGQEIAVVGLVSGRGRLISLNLFQTRPFFTTMCGPLEASSSPFTEAVAGAVILSAVEGSLIISGHPARWPHVRRPEIDRDRFDPFPTSSGLAASTQSLRKTAEHVKPPASAARLHLPAHGPSASPRVESQKPRFTMTGSRVGDVGAYRALAAQPLRSNGIQREQEVNDDASRTSPG